MAPAPVTMLAKALYFCTLLVSKELAVTTVLVKLRRTEPFGGHSERLMLVLIRLLRGTHRQTHHRDISH